MTQNLLEKAQSNWAEFEKAAAERIKTGQPLIGEDGILTPLIKKIVEASLEAEIAEHLEECSEQGIDNWRNGTLSKTVKSGSGSVDLTTPRDRAGTFEPQIVKKRQTILNESLDNKVIGLYSLGMSYQDICNHMEEIYGVELSPGLLSKITDKLLPMISEWRNRPLESIYTVLFLDAMYFKARENGRVMTKVVYNLLGINQFGHKGVLARRRPKHGK